MNGQIAKHMPHEWMNETMNEQTGLRRIPEKIIVI